MLSLWNAYTFMMRTPTCDVITVVKTVAVQEARFGLHANWTILSVFRQTQGEGGPLTIASSSTRL